MKFRYMAQKKRQVVTDAIAFAEGLTVNQAFWNDMESLPQFTQTDDPTKFTLPEIAASIQACDDEVDVYHYTSKDPDSTATAYVSSTHPFHIHLNTRKLNRSEASHTGTLIHEFVHVVDCFHDRVGSNKKFEYGHSKKATPARPKSAPYAIGNLAIRHWKIEHGEKVSPGLEDMEDYLSAEGFDCDYGDIKPEALDE